MPVHDWAKAYAGHFHHFHQQWTGEICDSLNAGVLPDGYFAHVEQKGLGVEPDVMALNWRREPAAPPGPGGGITVADSPPRVAHVTRRTEAGSYAGRANRLAVRTSPGRLVAVVEIVSPGNKDRRHSLNALVEKTLAFLAHGVNVLVVDLFPPTPRDPNGIHRAIWDEVEEDAFLPPPDRPLTLASYVGAPEYTAYVESVAIGAPLPDMPLFLDLFSYVPVPLEATYQRTWEKCPAAFKELVHHPELLDPSAG